MQLPTLPEALLAALRAAGILILVVITQSWAPYAAGAVVLYAVWSRARYATPALLTALLSAGIAGLLVAGISFIAGGL